MLGLRQEMDLTPNGFVTDANGDANFQIQLNYNIFQPGVSPVVLRPGATQTVAVAPASGTCVSSSTGALPSRIESGYMRVYNTSTVANLPATSPAFQVLDALLIGIVME